MLKVKLTVSLLNNATPEDLAEMARFLRRQAQQISRRAGPAPKKFKPRKTYRALLETALPVAPQEAAQEPQEVQQTPQEVQQTPQPA